MLEKSVVEKWWRRVLWRRLEKSVGEGCCGGVLWKSVGDVCWRGVEMCCREECCREVLEKSVGE